VLSNQSHQCLPKSKKTVWSISRPQQKSEIQSLKRRKFLWGLL